MSPDPARSLAPIFQPRSVAFVGASNNFTTMGTVQMVNTLRGGFQGPVIPVHPSEPVVLGQKAYKRLTDLPEPVDLAVLIVPTAVVLDVVRDAIQRGIRHLVITTAGFREVGPEGAAREAELRELAAGAGLRFVGPNCIGVMNTHLGLNTTFFPYRHAPGGLSLASQSGTYITQTLELLARWGISLAKAASVGNAVDIDLADCLDYFADDPDTRAVGLYVEGIRDGRRFLAAARRCTARKPVVAVYVGGSEGGARSGHSHTGALAGPDALYDGVFRQAGILRAPDMASLYQWGWALASQPLPRGPRVAVLTHSGGPATSMADAVYRWGLELPLLPEALQADIKKRIPSTGSALNPVDLTFSMNPKLLGVKLPHMLLSEPGIDGLLIHGIQGSSFFGAMAEMARGLVNIEVEQLAEFTEAFVPPLVEMNRELGKPIVMSGFFGRDDNMVKRLQDGGIPYYDSPERAVSAMAALYRAGRLQARRG
ncbi:MAG TPA: CoA-binding protein [Myxococcota bacterium]|nr:CoA-binding protein [Myxococcota bacterium]HRY94356.1 CoA-binding protein [Myxococcota bacterium]HSA23613.1 CoA-binding protein [Myxococcota bacterium]